MYDYIDRPVSSLDAGSRLLVWLMRNWVQSVASGRCPCGAIGPTFVQYDIPDALPHFQIMMMIFNREGLESFHFGDVNCNRVHEHEALFIALVHDIQTSRLQSVRDTLTLIVEGEAVGPLTMAISALANEMACVGLLQSKAATSEFKQGEPDSRAPTKGNEE